MKKIFTLVAAVLATISLSATQTVLQPGSNQLVQAITDANAGDTIIFQTGTYTEAAGSSPVLPAKKITLMAAEGATPTLVTYSCKINADFEINGFEIINASTDNYLLRTGGNVDGTIAFKNCSFKLHENVATPIGFIYLSSNSVGSLIIDNCIFSDNTDASGAILRAQQAKIGSFSMTNSTAYNMPVDHAIFCEGITNGYVDHCTFYNCGIRTVYMKGSTMTDYLVQNCIFMNPTEPTENNYCVATYAGDVKNVLHYNVKAPRSSDATVSGSINADPIFADPANGDFNLTKGSPAIGAATDKSNLGDPRWTVYDPTAIVNTKAEQSCKKVMVNGQMMIVKDGKAYNVLGF